MRQRITRPRRRDPFGCPQATPAIFAAHYPLCVPAALLAGFGPTTCKQHTSRSIVRCYGAAVSPSSAAFALALDPLQVALPIAGWFAIIVVVLLGVTVFVPSARRRYFALAGFMLAAAAVASGTLAQALADAGVEVQADRLILRDFGERELPLRELRTTSIRVEDFDQRQLRAPVLDVQSWALPGYTRGWMRLANGRLAWVMLPAGVKRVVFISTLHPFDLVLGVADTAGLARALKGQA